MKKKLLSVFICAAFLCSMLTAAVSFKPEDIKSESRMSLGYSIINGYSKLSAKAGLKSYDKAAVYSGLDLSNPYIVTLAGTFYLTRGIDLERLVTDNDYAYSLVEKLDGFMGRLFVSNERAAKLKKRLTENGVNIKKAYDTVGLFIVETNTETAQALMEDEAVDFVMAGGEVPSTMKDLNLDGSSDALDATVIQEYIAGKIDYSDRDENEYIKFAGDINGDKEFDIRDATAALKKAIPRA